MIKIKIELGDEIKHDITGVKGIATSRTSYVSGCDRITIQQKVQKDGKLPEGLQFDEPELTVVKKNRKKNTNNKVGGYKPQARHYFK